MVNPYTQDEKVVQKLINRFITTANFVVSTDVRMAESQAKSLMNSIFEANATIYDAQVESKHPISIQYYLL